MDTDLVTADAIDRLTAVLPGFAARLRIGEATPELRRQYRHMLNDIADMCAPPPTQPLPRPAGRRDSPKVINRSGDAPV